MTIEVKEMLNLTECFASVQGETSFTGWPTFFIRLATCNQRCVWCDTKYSFKRGTPTDLTQIYQAVENSGCQHVCITGGEPLLQTNVYALMQRLCDLEYIVSLETGGSLSTQNVDPRVHVILDIKCPASGMSEKNFWPNIDLLKKHDEVKFVISDSEDYRWAKDIAEKHDLFSKVDNVLFSPVHETLDAKTLVAWILADKLPVRLNLQMHKYVWSPETRGV